jgi:hypothetical protein
VNIIEDGVAVHQHPSLASSLLLIGARYVSRSSASPFINQPMDAPVLVYW